MGSKQLQQSIRITPRLVMACIIAILPGCGGPTAVEVPPIQPDEAAQGVLKQYDTNGDGQLTLEELASCPGIRDAIARYDKDGNQQISAAELSKRFAMWVDGGVGVTTLTCNVMFNGKPLDGAQVQLIPEAFLADAIEPAIGVTDQSGFAILAIDTAHLPDDMKNLRGVVHQGVFRVEITHPSIDIPTKYNSQTTLGQEVSADTGENFIRWKLTGK
ncbi:MAG: hypothetical protein ABGX16_19535 [Pirellulales bacterium]